MRNFQFSIFNAAAALLGLSILALTSPAQEMTQTFHLVPGWNAIYLELDMANRSIDPLIAGLPISSVWTWNARISSTDFIQDPNEQFRNSEKWVVHYAPNRV